MDVMKRSLLHLLFEINVKFRVYSVPNEAFVKIEKKK